MSTANPNIGAYSRDELIKLVNNVERQEKRIEELGTYEVYRRLNQFRRVAGASGGQGRCKQGI
jgi:hypothetical protein